jgi:hypothetical protein
MIFLKLGGPIVPSEAISTAYFVIPPISNTNNAASQIVEIIILILLECLNSHET